MGSKQVNHAMDQVYIYRSLLSPLEATDNSGRNDRSLRGADVNKLGMLSSRSDYARMGDRREEGGQDDFSTWSVAIFQSLNRKGEKFNIRKNSKIILRLFQHWFNHKLTALPPQGLLSKLPQNESLKAECALPTSRDGKSEVSLQSHTLLLKALCQTVLCLPGFGDSSDSVTSDLFLSLQSLLLPLTVLSVRPCLSLLPIRVYPKYRVSS